jgi:drug/metabolite transporter (DMT)-like permease
MRRPVVGGAMVLGAAVLWGSLGIFAKRLYDLGLTPRELASVRASVAFLGLALWALARPSGFRVRPRDLPFFALYGLVSIAGFQYLYFATLERTTVSIAVALLYTAPGFVVILSRLFGGEPIGGAKLTALGLVLSGVFLVTGALGMLVTGDAVVSPAALILGLASGLTYGLYTLFGKRALARYAPVATVFYAFLFGALVMAALEPPWRPFTARPEATPLLLALGLFPTLAAYLLYIGGLRHLASGTASMLACLEPVVAALLGLAILGEGIGGDQIAGIALIVGAALLLARTAAEPRADEGAATDAGISSSASR